MISYEGRQALTEHIEGDVGGHGDAQAVVSLAGDDAALVFSAHTHTHLRPGEGETSVNGKP